MSDDLPLNDPQTLYRRWEDSQWSPFGIDLSRDRDQWPTLGLTSFKFITDYLKQNELLPGFVEGYSYIHRDETRHIGYGVWFLRETVKAHPDQAETVRRTLRDLLPAVADSLQPPGDGTAALGVSDDDVRSFALRGLMRRLSIVGVALDSA